MKNVSASLYGGSIYLETNNSLVLNLSTIDTTAINNKYEDEELFSMGGTLYVNHDNSIILEKSSIFNSISNYDSGFLHA